MVHQHVTTSPAHSKRNSKTKFHQMNYPTAWSNQNPIPKWNIQIPIEAQPNPGPSYGLLVED